MQCRHRETEIFNNVFVNSWHFLWPSLLLYCTASATHCTSLYNMLLNMCGAAWQRLCCVSFHFCFGRVPKLKNQVSQKWSLITTEKVPSFNMMCCSAQTENSLSIENITSLINHVASYCIPAVYVYLLSPPSAVASPVNTSDPVPVHCRPRVHGMVLTPPNLTGDAVCDRMLVSGQMEAEQWGNRAALDQDAHLTLYEKLYM